MPRTKYVRSSKVRSKISTSVKTKTEPKDSFLNSGGGSQDVVSLFISSFENDLTTELFSINNFDAFSIEQVNQITFEELTISNSENSKKTVKELRTEKSFNATAMKSILSDSSRSKLLTSITNSTFANRKKKKQTDDEGYLTAGESANSDLTTASSGRLRSSSATRHGRTQARQPTHPRRSRSLVQGKNVRICAPDKITPLKAMQPPNFFGMITPKIKPNMAISVLRHPKQGEIAMSMRGSPLVVNSIVSEDCANVNIPLTDGRVISMQPNRCLRMSEIPSLDHLDEHTRQQLLTLRDNLSKVVELAYDQENRN